MASNVHPVAALAASGTIGPTTTADATYFGFSLHESAGAAATVRIRSGGMVTGQILDTIIFTSGQSFRQWYGPQGIQARGGLYFELAAGSVDGSVFAA